MHDGTEQGDSAYLCLNPNARGQAKPQTPEHIRKWRKSNFLDPGKRVIHPALIDDFKNVDDQNVVFGITAQDGESCHVEDVLNLLPEGECEKVVLELKEAEYKSSQLEPLGRSFYRGHKQPEFTQASDFRYGVTSAKSNEDAKSLLYPGESVKVENNEDTARTKANYIKSHRSYLPGEQKRRDYNWPVDPLTTVFGDKGENFALRRSSRGVHDALHSNMDCIEKRQLKQNIPVSEDHVFGITTHGNSDNNMEDCQGVMRGNYSEQEQMPDKDLGKSVTPGFRNVISGMRTFGCPSVRTDIPKYGRTSVADAQNYGDDVNAEYLLRPGRYATIGVEGSDFSILRTRDCLKSVFMESDSFKMDGELFDNLFKSVCDSNGMASVEKIQCAYNNNNNKCCS